MNNKKQMAGWKDYYVDKHGNVWSYKKRKWRKLKPTMGRSGYLRVTLTQTETMPVHHLIAEAFCKKRIGKHWVLHDNDNVYDNSARNLYYGDQKDNALDMIRNKRSLAGEKNVKSKTKPSEVRKMRRLRKMGYSVTDIAQKMKTTIGIVSAVTTYRTWKHIK